MGFFSDLKSKLSSKEQGYEQIPDSGIAEMQPLPENELGNIDNMPSTSKNFRLVPDSEKLPNIEDVEDPELFKEYRGKAYQNKDSDIPPFEQETESETKKDSDIPPFEQEEPEIKKEQETKKESTPEPDDIPEEPESKTGTQSTMPTEEEINAYKDEVAYQEKFGSKSKSDSKSKPQEGGFSTFVNNLRYGDKSPSSSAKDREYAVVAGFYGPSREDLVDSTNNLSQRNIYLKDQITRIEEEIKELKSEKAQLKKDGKAYAEITREINKLEDRKTTYEAEINKNISTIQQNARHSAEYEDAVRRGKSKLAMRNQVGKKLQNMSLGAGEVSSGVYEKTKVNRDWFGPKGFMSQPYKQANLTQNPVEPVKTKLRNLDSITQNTGSSIGRGMLYGAIAKPNRNIAPLGVPGGGNLSNTNIATLGVSGTVGGSRNKFDLTIPSRKLNTAEFATPFHRDFRPDMSSPNVSVQTQQYRQVVQADGSVVNVPVDAQYRESKAMIALVRRGTKSSIRQYNNKSFNLGNIGGFKTNPVTKSKIGSGIDVSHNRFTRGEVITTNYDTKHKGETKVSKAIESIGKLHNQTNISVTTKPMFNLELVDFGAYLKTPVKRVEKQKQSENVTSLLNIGKKLNKLVSQRKVKKV